MTVCAPLTNKDLNFSLLCCAFSKWTLRSHILWTFVFLCLCFDILYSYIIGFSNLNALERTGEGDYPDYPQSPRHVPENLLAGEGDVSSTTFPEYTESKKETSLPLEGDQYSMVHTSPSYSFGFMPPMVNSQIAPFESSDAQARDVSRLPSFVVSF